MLEDVLQGFLLHVLVLYAIPGAVLLGVTVWIVRKQHRDTGRRLDREPKP